MDRQIDLMRFLKEFVIPSPGRVLAGSHLCRSILGII